LGCVQGDVGDVDFKVLVKVGVASITIQGERFPLGWKRGVGDKGGGGTGWLIIAGKVEVML